MKTGACDRGALPAGWRWHHAEKMQLLGRTAERSAGQMHAPAVGGADTGFDDVRARVEATLNKLWDLHKAGLPLQQTQARARLAAQSRPQHVLCSQAV